MQEVYPVALAMGLSGGGLSMNSGTARLAQNQNGRVEKAMVEGRYSVLLPDGTRVEVTGPRGLRVGDPVRLVQGKTSEVTETRSAKAVAGGSPGPQGDLSLFMPLLMRGQEIPIRVEIFLPDRGKLGRRSKGRVVTFVFDVTTRLLGRIQWGVHLQGRDVALQVFAEADHRVTVKAMAVRTEKALQERGFVLSAPTLMLKRPFEVPAGSLNVRG